MSCEQEINSSKETCVFLPNVLMVQKNANCPYGYSYYESPYPVCIDKTSIPPGYDCTKDPLQCTRSRHITSLETFQYTSLKKAYHH